MNGSKRKRNQVKGGREGKCKNDEGKVKEMNEKKEGRKDKGKNRMKTTGVIFLGRLFFLCCY